MAKYGDVNPATGIKYTPQEIMKVNSGIDISGGATATNTSLTTPASGYTPLPGQIGWNATPEEQALAREEYIAGGWGAGAGGSTTPPPGHIPGQRSPRDESGTCSATGDTVAGVPALAPYTPSAEATALAGQVGGAISGIIEKKGLGIGEEVKEDLFLREAEMINASNVQSIKNMEDEMARRGMSNSGQVFSETMKLNSKADIQMANVMRDVEIADAYMKLASYENAIGMGVQFLSYLSDEAWRQYQPTLMQWQAEVDMYKMAIQQAYAVGNMELAHQNTMELAQFEANTAIQMEEMKLESANKIAAAEGAGNIFTAILGWLIPGS